MLVSPPQNTIQNEAFSLSASSSSPPFVVAGSLCFPSCLVTLDMGLRDPVVLPNGTTADALQHWMLPSKVSVRTFVFSDACWSCLDASPFFSFAVHCLNTSKGASTQQ